MEETHVERENSLALIEPVKPEERTDQNKLTEPARERILTQIEAQIRKTGNFSINSIKNQLGVQWVTAQQLLKQTAERILANTEDIRSFELRYYMDLVQNAQDQENWEDFGITNKREEEELLADYYHKIHEILKLKYTPDAAIAGNPAGAINLSLFNMMSPKVQEFVKSNYGVDPAAVVQPNDAEVVVDPIPEAPSIVTAIVDDTHS